MVINPSLVWEDVAQEDFCSGKEGEGEYDLIQALWAGLAGHKGTQ